jgi:oxygen-dependent protoporphyrinogen oxidase
MSALPSPGIAPARVVIVGGGIAGLAVAHALRARAPHLEILVLEASDRPGGCIRSERIDGYLCEEGADGFLDNAPATLALAADVGLSSSLMPSRDDARRRFIFRRHQLHEVPTTAFAFASTGLLSAAAKLRVLAEPFASRPPGGDMSILRFAERHIGREAAAVLVGSMVSGIFAGDASQLSLRSCFPRMHEMEAQYGSLVRAMLAKRAVNKHREAATGEHGQTAAEETRTAPGAPAGRLTSFEGGMEELARATAASLGPILRTNHRVTDLRVRVSAAGSVPRLVGARTFSIVCHGRRIEADAVVLAGPADTSADLVRPFAPEAANLLGAIETAPLAVVCLGYDAAAVTAERGPLNGFGFLVPRGERPRILGTLWETSIYGGRAPAGKMLLRVMIGGALDRDAVELDDTTLLRLVRRDLELTMRLRLRPEFVHPVRHRRGIPQYTIGHGARLERIERALGACPGLFLAGNSYRGVSVNACIEDAQRVAKLVAGHLAVTAQRAERAV